MLCTFTARAVLEGDVKVGYLGERIAVLIDRVIDVVRFTYMDDFEGWQGFAIFASHGCKVVGVQAQPPGCHCW